MDEDEYALYSEFQKEFGMAELAKKGIEYLKKSGIKETAKKAYGAAKRVAKNYFDKAKTSFFKPTEFPKSVIG
jgi:beta-N-acetylglucosaminidase